MVFGRTIYKMDCGQVRIMIINKSMVKVEYMQEACSPSLISDQHFEIQCFYIVALLVLSLVIV